MSWQVIGHEREVQALQRDVASGRLRHAYLLAGARGMGKRTLAWEFIKAILCEGNNAPCGACRACKLIAAGNHPDVITVSPVVSGKIIKTEKIMIERMRELIKALNLKPVEAKRKIALITNFETANEESANAFLKTLEEPPGDALLILTTDNMEMLLETIKSRCEVVQLKPLPALMIQNALTNQWGVAPARAELLARLSGGRLGWAVNADEQVLEQRAQRLEELKKLLTAPRVKRFAYAEQLAKDRAFLKDVLDLWLSWWRDVLLIATGAPTLPINVDQTSHLQRAAEQIGLDQASAMIEAIQRTNTALARNANARLALEVLMLEMPQG